MDSTKTGIVDKVNAFANHRPDSESGLQKHTVSDRMDPTSEETIAAAITQLNSHNDHDAHVTTGLVAESPDHDAALAEQHFRDTYGFDFRNFSVNPCLSPNLDSSVRNDGDVDPKTAARFDNWLRLSPFGIWVTKYPTSKPYAQCKYSQCRLQFKFDGHANTSNIIKHMRRRHKEDYELFVSLLGRDQKQKGTTSSHGNAFDQQTHNSSAPRKAFSLRKELAPLLQNKQFPQKQLNVFIDSLLPLSTANSFAQFLKACNFSNGEFLLTPDDMILKLDEYFHEFEAQLKETLQSSTLVNLVLDTWTSPENRVYLALMVSFCPNLALEDQTLKRDSITLKSGPNVHVLDLLEIGNESTNILPIVLQTLSDYAILHKISSVTSDSGSNILVDLQDQLRKSLQAEGDKDLIEIRSFSHTLENVLELLLRIFRENYPKLVAKIDGLFVVLQKNAYLKKPFRKFLNVATPSRLKPGPVSRYRYLLTFLKFEHEFSSFRSTGGLEKLSGSAADELRVFSYSPEEIAVLRIFLKAIGIFGNYIKILQDDTVDILPNAIDYYVQIGQYFQACDRILSGIYAEQDVIFVGLRDEDLLTIDENTKNNLFTIISTCSSYFNPQLEWTLKQSGYWVAHILQPHNKTTKLAGSFDDVRFKDEVLQNASAYIDHHLKSQSDNFVVELEETSGNRAIRSNLKRVTKPVSTKRRSELDLADQAAALANFTEHELGLGSEWALYLDEPTEETTDVVKYWVRNQKKFPMLAKLALSLHNCKLSSSKVEKWFRMGREALNASISQGSMSLKQAVVLRNRLLNFQPAHVLNFVEFVAAAQWGADENRTLGGADEGSS
ncbi:putative transposase of the Rover hAT-like DNA transposon [Lachancea lanzarotensis]|uniref:LALA0S02e04148g1_1 n=1 Tax=Lachancea lanzarotensis TaxID=1245769 RepID=A0A0C7MU63_9SACH|nr:putative transposase of the Rover hAT-like DNA transposon [Lachancea lanzarotensis]CEP60984.1 putative transposase of the Rover hAT-like DNA transposon [Lachancea lanzarotensis]